MSEQEFWQRVVAAVMARGRAIVCPPGYFSPPSLEVWAF